MASTEAYYTAAAVREMDRLAIEEHGIPAFELMQRAGKEAFLALRSRWPRHDKLLVCCGTGNNGGDGFVIAALAQDAGLDVRILLLGDSAQLHGAARQAWDMALAAGVPVVDAANFSWGSESNQNCIVVDAILGTGVKGRVRDDAASLVRAINASALPVLAVDVPSGLCTDTGAVLGVAVRADVTVTFIGRKAGQILGEGPAHCGTVLFSDLGIPASIRQSVSRAQES